MFGKKKKQSRIAERVFPYLDDVLANELHRRAERGDVVEELGPPPPARDYSTVGIVEHLLPLCDNDPNDLLEVMQAWQGAREQEFEQDEDRALLAGMIFLTAGLGGVGNLFGFIPESAPGFNPELAAEGRARGWRR
jgi:hypothetical protein